MAASLCLERSRDSIATLESEDAFVVVSEDLDNSGAGQIAVEANGTLLNISDQGDLSSVNMTFGSADADEETPLISAPLFPADSTPVADRSTPSPKPSFSPAIAKFDPTATISGSRATVDSPVTAPGPPASPRSQAALATIRAMRAHVRDVVLPYITRYISGELEPTTPTAAKSSTTASTLPAAAAATQQQRAAAQRKRQVRQLQQQLAFTTASGRKPQQSESSSDDEEDDDRAGRLIFAGQHDRTFAALERALEHVNTDLYKVFGDAQVMSARDRLLTYVGEELRQLREHHNEMPQKLVIKAKRRPEPATASATGLTIRTAMVAVNEALLPRLSSAPAMTTVPSAGDRIPTVTPGAVSPSAVIVRTAAAPNAVTPVTPVAVASSVVTPSTAAPASATPSKTVSAPVTPPPSPLAHKSTSASPSPVRAATVTTAPSPTSATSQVPNLLTSPGSSPGAAVVSGSVPSSPQRSVLQVRTVVPSSEQVHELLSSAVRDFSPVGSVIRHANTAPLPMSATVSPFPQQQENQHQHQQKTVGVSEKAAASIASALSVGRELPVAVVAVATDATQPRDEQRQQKQLQQEEEEKRLQQQQQQQQRVEALLACVRTDSEEMICRNQELEVQIAAQQLQVNDLRQLRAAQQHQHLIEEQQLIQQTEQQHQQSLAQQAQARQHLHQLRTQLQQLNEQIQHTGDQIMTLHEQRRQQTRMAVGALYSPQVSAPIVTAAAVSASVASSTVAAARPVNRQYQQPVMVASAETQFRGARPSPVTTTTTLTAATAAAPMPFMTTSTSTTADDRSSPVQFDEYECVFLCGQAFGSQAELAAHVHRVHCE
eukprot:TRINITY_DN624_c0_g1_i1.p1 TRINITY_DN624_c0_g1~~TRINITY_DN624_c0_g1_i1.p1  ORF type:complete len:831 (-),score=259.11 TRINITY_DN624_c0_g1_i1:2-2494(-)